jgi:hypothetical protein
MYQLSREGKKTTLPVLSFSHYFHSYFHSKYPWGLEASGKENYRKSKNKKTTTKKKKQRKANTEIENT